MGWRVRYSSVFKPFYQSNQEYINSLREDTQDSQHSRRRTCGRCGSVGHQPSGSVEGRTKLLVQIKINACAVLTSNLALLKVAQQAENTKVNPGRRRIAHRSTAFCTYRYPCLLPALIYRPSLVLSIHSLHLIRCSLALLVPVGAWAFTSKLSLHLRACSGSTADFKQQWESILFIRVHTL